MNFRIPTAVSLACLATGCWVGPVVGPHIESPVVSNDGGTSRFDGGDGPGFQKLLADVIIPSCAVSFCHKANPPPAAPMALEEEAAYAQLVNVSASQEPTLMRVKPGDPANSYLMIKLRSMAANTYGTTLMPLNRAPLDEAALQAIENWIARGAPND